MNYYRINPVEYAKDRRRRQDSPTGGWIICPGSFFPRRPGIEIDGQLIHAIPIRKRNVYHAMCDRCCIQFQLNGYIWRELKVPPKFCGGDNVVPGIALSAAEAEILCPLLTEAKLKAINIWQDRIWPNVFTSKPDSPESSKPHNGLIIDEGGKNERPVQS